MRNPPPELPHPDEVRAALAGAEARATGAVLGIKRRSRKWVLVVAGAYVVTLVGLAVLGALLYQATRQIVALQKAQAASSANGRTLLAKVLTLSEQIAAFSDPNSQAAKEQQAKIAQALQLFDEAQRLGRADQLKKIAQMFEQCTRLPCDPAVVNRILAQPVPVPTFGGASAPPASSAAPAKPASTAGASVGKSSSAAAVPKPCPGPVVIQATPLTLPLLPPADVNVCIPAPPNP